METNRTLISGTTKDISAGGAFIQCLEPLEPNEVFELAMSVPCSNPPIKAIAEVVRLHNSNLKNGHDPNGMAIKFIIISDEYRKIISDLVLDRLESKGYQLER